MSFAEGLTKIVAEKREEQKSREKLANKWRAHESKLLTELVEAFKKKCMKEAENERCEASVSFAALVREVSEFPTHVVIDSQHLVDNWGDGAASWWYYAHRGTNNEWVTGSPVSFAELLESMMPKFLEQAQDLGFQSCKREAGTWKVVASWKPPSA
eukprot:TRINITY_DN77591_c0_g1_i1.p1 TRINITY_DN77591_c0_g1~~TRINITY_DN77591_c0_g1_i1.p1  ORF type:complete len:156 (+),score=39.17 TRINITY_DN77591_c0_g1_i1:107-574(+)